MVAPPGAMRQRPGTETMTAAGASFCSHTSLGRRMSSRRTSGCSSSRPSTFDRPGAWDQVRAAAEALLLHKKLSGRKVRAVAGAAFEKALSEVYQKMALAPLSQGGDHDPDYCPGGTPR